MDKIDELRGIIEFVAAANAGSFSAASRTLGVSVAHVSRAVRDLEQKIGVQLIQRNTRQSTLTAEGRTFFEQCRLILDELSEAKEQLQSGQQAVRGLIRISMNGYFAESRIAPALAEFALQNPDVVLDVEMNSRNVSLVEEGFDLAIRAGPLEHSELISRRLIGFPVVTLASPNLLESVEHIDHPRQLNPGLCLPLGNRSWTFQRNKERFDLGAVGSFRSNNGALLVAAAVAGLGIIRAPSYYGRDEIQIGTLVPILPDWVDPKGDFQFYLLYPAQRHLPHRVRLLIDHIVDQCGA
jgi:DNA-binding transcriptional LysR family regulator